MIKYSRIKRIHFIGIGGAGMSGIAEVLHNMGFTVTGSDMSGSSTINHLIRLGIKVFLGHSAEWVKEVETVVYSSAIKPENVELKAARARKIPVIPRAEMLAELMRLKFSIAVAGTHGKTTTTSMVASILSSAQKDPTYVVGGKIRVEDSGAKLGKSDYLICEADESDGSFVHLFPTVAAVTNIEDDHLDHYQNMDNLLNAFLEFANKVPFYGAVILNGQSPNVNKLLALINKPMVVCGLNQKYDIGVDNIKVDVYNAEFDLWVRGGKWGCVRLHIGGRHNVENAVVAIAACIQLGIDFPSIQDGLLRFQLPERRFQILYKSDTYVVIDDYAHHPTEIKATLSTLKMGSFKRIIAIFQPHRFTRLQILMNEFVKSFNGIDELIISRIYAANQDEIADISSRVLFDRIKQSGLEKVEYIEDFDGIIESLRQNRQEGDAVIFLSAGDLTHLAHRYAAQLKENSK